jgi:hypothetical protein
LFSRLYYLIEIQSLWKVLFYLNEKNDAKFYTLFPSSKDLFFKKYRTLIDSFGLNNIIKKTDSSNNKDNKRTEKKQNRNQNYLDFFIDDLDLSFSPFFLHYVAPTIETFLSNVEVKSLQISTILKNIKVDKTDKTIYNINTNNNTESINKNDIIININNNNINNNNNNNINNKNNNNNNDCKVLLDDKNSKTTTKKNIKRLTPTKIFASSNINNTNILNSNFFIPINNQFDIEFSQKNVSNNNHNNNDNNNDDNLFTPTKKNTKNSEILNFSNATTIDCTTVDGNSENNFFCGKNDSNNNTINNNEFTGNSNSVNFKNNENNTNNKNINNNNDINGVKFSRSVSDCNSPFSYSTSNFKKFEKNESPMKTSQLKSATKINKNLFDSNCKNKNNFNNNDNYNDNVKNNNNDNNNNNNNKNLDTISTNLFPTNTDSTYAVLEKFFFINFF